MKQSNFQFLNPYLKEINYVLNSDLDPKNEEIKMNNSFDIQVKRIENENKANVELTLETNIENENAPFKLVIKVASDFKWMDLDEETVENMLNVNAPSLLISYMRPIIANVTNASGLPAYNLPFINLVD